jgi:hypothetical protein
MKPLLALALLLAAPPCSAAEIVRHGDLITISGQLLDGDIAEFQSVITGGHAQVVLTGSGGSLAGGVMIGVMIRASGYDTAARGMCYSACTTTCHDGSSCVAPDRRVDQEGRSDVDDRKSVSAGIRERKERDLGWRDPEHLHISTTKSSRAGSPSGTGSPG